MHESLIAALAVAFALVGCVLVTGVGRIPVLVAQLSERLGRGSGLLAASWVAVIASSALAAWLGALLAPLLAPAGKLTFLALALLFAAADLLIRRQRIPPEEPTRSFGAILLVLFLGQIADGSRFLILALAAVSGAGPWVAIAGAVGSGIALTAGWVFTERWNDHLKLRHLRAGVAMLLLIAALLAGLVVVLPH